MSTDILSTAFELVLGGWRSQALYAGVVLGTFEALDAEDRSSEEVAARLGVDGSAFYRLLRALATSGLLHEDDARRFRLTELGACFRSDHPASLRAALLLEAGPVHTAAWKHLPELISSGRGTGFEREFGVTAWDHMRRNHDYNVTFTKAMSSYSANEAPAIRRALEGKRFGSDVLCDIGGSHGALLDELLRDRPNTRGIVLDLPEVIATRPAAGEPANASTRSIDFVGGDMFEDVPTADVYFLKHILHDWADEECRRILSSIRRAAKPTSRLFVCELVVPGPEQPHFAKLFDLHMMLMYASRERTAHEYASLLDETGWRSTQTLQLAGTFSELLEAGAR